MSARKNYPLPTEGQIKGAILGLAVGDALGVPVEFREREELDGCPIVDMEGYGRYPLPAGCWSDDTSMTLAAMDSIAEKRAVDCDDIMVRFGKWYYQNAYTPTDIRFDAGNICASAIDRYFAEHIDAAHCGIRRESGNSNGSLMRILPFVLYGSTHPRENRAAVKKGSALTHAHPRSLLACVIYGEVAHAILRDPSKEVVEAALADCEFRFGGMAEWKHFTRLWSISRLPRSGIKSSGYVVDTLEAALWCLAVTDNYRDCVLTAVNLGGDTDTTAAVAGGLAGILYGFDAIPRQWLATLKKEREIETLCDRFREAIRCK